MQTESFGARLRLERERRQVALAAIAEQTKIKISLLDGLERDDFSHWPEGIFRRGYMRAYAKAIGLDADAVVREFLEFYPDPVDASPVDDRPSSRLRDLFGRLRRSERAEQVVVNVPAADPEPHVEVSIPGRRATISVSDAAPPRAMPAEPAAAVPRDSPPVAGNLTALGHLCTRLARAVDLAEVGAALEEAANVFDAVGMILWVWDPRAAALAPVLGHGYSHTMLAQLPRIPRGADNPIASVFRSADTRIVDGNHTATGAIVAPLMTPAGCGGVLAIELPHGGEQREGVRAFAVILAAQLATLLVCPDLAEAVNA